jgi:hypothetical protein
MGDFHRLKSAAANENRRNSQSIPGLQPPAEIRPQP